MKNTESKAIPLRKDRLLRSQGLDPSETRGKQPPTVCPECRVVFADGRWQWGTPPPQAAEGLCPACKRVADKHPAGIVTIGGAFFGAHAEEILHVVRNTEQHAKEEHPLQRIMNIEHTADGAVITTTDVHLARGIGEALQHAYRGDLDFTYADGDVTIRVSWSR